ncbi:MAG: hypothetical protein WBE34_00120 [Candidatus Nitrosopolaris sp.]
MLDKRQLLATTVDLSDESLATLQIFFITPLTSFKVNYKKTVKAWTVGISNL